MTEDTQTVAEAVFAAFGQETPEEYKARPQESQEPAETLAETRDDGRDDKGRFAKKDGESEQPVEKADDKPVEQTTDTSPEKVEAPEEPQQTDNTSARPPGGWSVASKAEWEKLPDSVRADIAKRENEVNEGFKQYSGLKDVIPYQQHYTQQGSSVKQALDAYTALDNAMSRDAVSTIAYMCEQKGVQPVHMAYAILQKAGIQIPEQQGQPQASQPQVFKDPRVDEIQRMLEEDRRNREVAEHQQVSQTIEQFSADPKNRYFENVKVTMGHLIQTGQASGLQDAYDKACWANPEIRTLLIKQQTAAQAAQTQPQRQAEAAAQARSAARGITGSPIPGGSSGSGKSPKLSDRQAIKEALKAQGVAV